MESNNIFRVSVGCLALGLALALSACGEEHKDIPTDGFEANYSFDPQTIQAAIDANQPELFYEEWNWRHFETERPPPARETRLAPEPDFVPLPWIEDDFRRVFNTFVEQERKDFSSDLGPYHIVFYTDCQYATIGIQRMAFSYFQKRGPEDYLKWGANIDLPISRLGWYESTLNDVGDEKQPLAKGHITAEAALQMAEQAGGKALRGEVNDNCFISGYIISSDATYLDNVWRISYNRSTVTLYELHISPDGSQVNVVITPVP
jgi:hypothetical protein